MMSSARIVFPDIAVVGAALLLKGFSGRSDGIYEREVKILLILKVPSS